MTMPHAGIEGVRGDSMTSTQILTSIENQQKRYYVYTLAYPNGEVFYVGKGVGNRMYHHEVEAASTARVAYRNRKKLEVIREVWASGGQVQKSIVFETDVEEDAFMYEWALINMACTAERLTNVSTSGMRKSFVPEPRPKYKSLSQIPPKVEAISIKTGKSSIEIGGETYYTAAEAARYLGVSRDSFMRNVKPRLQSYKHGALRREYFLRADLDEFRGIHPTDEDNQDDR